MKRKSPAPRRHEQRRITKLTPEQQAYVVRRLATYDSSTAVARDLKELFGIEMTVPAVDHYHPERVARVKLAPRWQELFWETRNAYIAASAQASTMEQMVRVRLREDMVLMARDAGHYRAANELLDSIAKEAGKMFTSRYTLKLEEESASTWKRGTIIYEYDDCIKIDRGDPAGPTIHLRRLGPKGGGEPSPADGADAGTGAPGVSGDDAGPVLEPAPRGKS